MLPNETKTDTPVSVWLHNQEPQNLNVMPAYCGKMSEQDVQSYMTTLHNAAEQGIGNIRNFSATLVRTKYIRFSYCPAHKYPSIDDGSEPLKLQIKIQRCNFSKCENCFANIINGKCTDPFVVKYVGKKFFADKYKDKTK